MPQKTALKDCTFLIPIRLDSAERLENLKKVVSYLISYLDTTIVVLEAPPRKDLSLKEVLGPSIQIIPVSDNDPIFHRTKYINVLANHAATKFFAVWDADVIISIPQIEESMRLLRENIVDFVIPYDGRFLDTGLETRRDFFRDNDFQILIDNKNNMKGMYGYNAAGGGFFGNREKYFEAGLENENFYGWGIEDGERIRRWEILDLRSQRIHGPMFHFTHPRGINSNFHSRNGQIRSIKEYLRITRMSKAELLEEVNNWKWR